MPFWFAIPLGAGFLAVLITLIRRRGTSSVTTLHIDH
jgi:hypothetical protein